MYGAIDDLYQENARFSKLKLFFRTLYYIKYGTDYYLTCLVLSFCSKLLVEEPCGVTENHTSPSTLLQILEDRTNKQLRSTMITNVLG